MLRGIYYYVIVISSGAK